MRFQFPSHNPTHTFLQAKKPIKICDMLMTWKPTVSAEGKSFRMIENKKEEIKRIISSKIQVYHSWKANWNGPPLKWNSNQKSTFDWYLAAVQTGSLSLCGHTYQTNKPVCIRIWKSIMFFVFILNFWFEIDNFAFTIHFDKC